MGNQPIGSGHLLSENRRRHNFNKFLFKYWFITLILINIPYVRHEFADRDGSCIMIQRLCTIWNQFKVSQKKFIKKHLSYSVPKMRKNRIWLGWITDIN